MAELGSNEYSPKKGNKRMIKKSTRIDLTPMVDLGFLLITFFVFTTTLAQPTVMKVDMPVGKDGGDPVCESCVITVILDSNNIIRYYEGDNKYNPVVNETSFSHDGIRNILLQKKRAVKISRGSEDAFMLIIKPSPGSTFKNFVDMADEVTINNIKRYYIGELDETDKKFLLNHHN